MATVVILLAVVALAGILRVLAHDRRGDQETVSDAWLRNRIRERRD